ncbi:family 16 glycosylhydrolase [Zobellia galactanivorans]|uniref:family 16 glycosylhydrolase n=1 Tax=Zobellia galactanivorans (strain DSM 12802 / CCUG 47099 / CIP 106680 / NCIMB 13871 / Dsij) TaxID=63186 RepID=UPI001C071E5C|nr:family 16 glycosylhydrolase [Zobellia galactanivorans]MBU3027787.1 family 16 glycosylhydrolase [Zobellia galactanivorans]
MKINRKTPFYRMIMINYLSLSLSILLVALSCNSTDSGQDLKPTDLKVDITLVGTDDAHPNGNGSGIVEISASASNAVRYAFRFENGDVEDSTDGSTTHTFTEEGTHPYTIVVWAYSPTGEFINETFNVEVYKSNEAFNTLVFSDEFEYEGKPDPEKWHYQVIPPNNGSWHNNELQHYTNRSENSFVSDGTLKIRAIKEKYTFEGSTKDYTSARMNSKFAFTYGKVEVRAKLPSKKGTWPAIWTLGANSNETGNYFGEQYGNAEWPACGEIDILEQNGWDKESTIAHFHWSDLNSDEYQNLGGTTPITNASGSFHVYSLEWNASAMKVFLDDTLVYELKNSQNTPYNAPHYLLLNIAMGGTLGGDIPENFTDDIFEIDYVRIYQ